MRDSWAIKFAIQRLNNGYVVEIDPEGWLMHERYIYCRTLEEALMLLHGNIGQAIEAERAKPAS